MELASAQAIVARAYNMCDTEPHTRVSKRWRVTIFYSVSVAENGDILEDGVDLREDYDTLRCALTAVATFATGHGGLDLWDDCDGRIMSCWLNHIEGLDISYQAMLEHVEKEELWTHRGTAWQNLGRRMLEREGHLTVNRIRAAIS